MRVCGECPEIKVRHVGKQAKKNAERAKCWGKCVRQVYVLQASGNGTEIHKF